MAGNPYYQAQANASVDPSQGQVPQGQAPQYPAGATPPYPNPEQGMQPTGQGGFDEVAQIRDSILSQFPDLMRPDEPPMELDTSQKLTLFGLYMANPAGAMDMIRERRAREARRQELRAQMGMQALSAASSILKSQYETNRTILDMHTAVNEDWRKNKAADLNEHVQRTELALKQAQEARASREYADKQQFQGQLMKEAFGDPTQPSAGEEAAGMSIPDLHGQPRPSGMRRSISLTPGSASITMSDPSAGASRDPRVDFDGWLRGFIARFPGGAAGMPSHLSPDTEDGYRNLVTLWQKERSQLAPGSFGAMGGAPTAGMPGPVRGVTSRPGYDDLSGDAIEAYGR
jgi:hypothetical protein